MIVFTRQFRPYLLGRNFRLRTDHGSLTWLRNFKEPEGQLARWLEQLQELDFRIEHRPGRKHINADALSRLPCRQCGRENHDKEVVVAVTSLTSSEAEEFRRAQLEDPQIEPVSRAMGAKTKPPADEIKAASLSSRRLFQLWDQLAIVMDYSIASMNNGTAAESCHNLLFPCPGVRKYSGICTKA